MGRRRAGLNFRRQRKKINLPLVREVLSWIVELVVVIGLAYVLVSFFGIRTNVVGQAMEQTLENDDDILVNKFAYIISKPKQGDVIVFLPNGNKKSHYYVRRVVAVPGDTVKVHGKIKEGNRERIQVFEGTVIKKQNGSNRTTFTVRKLSNGVGVEKTWPLHSPNVEKVEIVRKGKVRRAKLYYLRDRIGKAAKVKELVK